MKCVLQVAMTLKKSIQTSEDKKNLFQIKKGNGGILSMSIQHLCHCS